MDVQQRTPMDVSNAAARSLGSLWGTAKFAGKSALGVAQLAVLAAQAQRGDMHAQIELGRAIMHAPSEALRFAKETPHRYDGALAKAEAHIAQGNHFGAGDVFTEEFTAPVTTAVVGVVEGGVALTRVGGEGPGESWGEDGGSGWGSRRRRSREWP